MFLEQREEARNGGGALINHTEVMNTIPSQCHGKEPRLQSTYLRKQQLENPNPGKKMDLTIQRRTQTVAPRADCGQKHIIMNMVCNVTGNGKKKNI